MDRKEFGDLIKKRRKELGITQEAISEIAKISVDYYKDIERGKYRPTWRIWLRLCAGLQIDILELQRIVVGKKE